MSKRVAISVSVIVAAAACGFSPGPYTAPSGLDGAAGGSSGSGAVVGDGSLGAGGLADGPIMLHGTGGATGIQDARGSDPDVPITPGGGGQPGSGGAGGLLATGGQSGYGGVPSSGGGHGGAGGIVATGGIVVGSGGGPGTGGVPALGGATGGAGAAGVGGSGRGGAGTGGTLAGSGGNRGTGGGPGTGGTIVGAGGSPGTGGAPGTGGSTGAGRSAGCGQTPTIPSTQYNNGTTIPITAAGMSRRYILNVPSPYDNTKAYRLIIAFHQRDGNDKSVYQNGYYHLLPLGSDSTIFVAPNGQYNGVPCTGTASGGDSGCGWQNTGNTDLALTDAIVAQIEQNFCVDPNRIFATGWSFGGAMSYHVACSRPQGGGASWFVRGVAVYSGAQLSGSCTPTKPVAYYASHGTADTVLGYDSGVGLFKSFSTPNGCSYVAPAKATSTHVCTTLTGCAVGYPTEFCSFVGDHTPDPKDSGVATSWEYQTAWNFLSQL